MTHLRQNRENAYLATLFLVALSIDLYFSLSGWGGRVIEHYGGFRQTQTAISAYYMVKDGLTIDYITPVLGPPWRIPIEFPTFQIIVAAWVKLTGMPLDQSGRLVSLMFFYLSLLPLYLILRRLGLRAGHVVVVLSLLLASPLYIFWSRTFMIESAALFFSLAAVHFCLKALDRPDARHVGGAVFTGTLAALTKTTTFSVFCVALLFILLARASRKSPSVPLFQRGISFIVYAALFVGVPMLAAKLWTAHADALKAGNPLAAPLLSKNLGEWVFGSMAQKADPAVWARIFWHWPQFVMGSALFYLLLPLAFMDKGRRPVAVAAGLSFVAGPLVFTNLYFVHEYYSYANGLFLILLVGLATIALIERPGLRLVGLALVPVLMVAMFMKYSSYYAPKVRLSAGLAEHSRLKDATKKDEVLLIYGQSWSPEIPYYAERKAIMAGLRWKIETPSLKRAIEAVGREKITAMVVCGERRTNEALVRHDVEYFGFRPFPLYSFASFPGFGQCDVYSARPLTPGR